MAPSNKDFRWQAQYFWVLVVLVCLLVVSVADLTLAVYWGHTVDDNNSFAGDVQYDSQVELAFYCGTMPLISLVWTAVSLCVTVRSTLHPVLALATSIILFIGWANQISFWFICEVSDTSEYPDYYCPAYLLTGLQSSFQDINGISMGKDWAGVLAMAFSAAFVALASIAVLKGRRGPPPEYTLPMYSEHRDDGEAHQTSRTTETSSETLNSDQQEEFGDCVRRTLQEKNDVLFVRNKKALDSYKIATSKAISM
ncbi:MAG: hypothetical protein Q9191_002059 [Dirinaria sp. TL-2023a]